MYVICNAHAKYNSSSHLWLLLFSKNCSFRTRVKDQRELWNVLQNNFAFMTFFVRPFATVIYENSSLSGRCNRRQVKPRNKNSESLVLTLRHQGFSQQYGKMFDDSIDHNSLSSFRSEWHDVAYSYTCFSRAMERKTRSKLHRRISTCNWWAFLIFPFASDWSILCDYSLHKRLSFCLYVKRSQIFRTMYK